MVRVRLIDGEEIEGVLDRIDGRRLRLRGTNKGKLIVLYRHSVTMIEDVVAA